MALLPQDFVNEMSRQLGDELPAFLCCYEQPYLRGVRRNLRKPTTADIAGEEAQIPWVENGHYLAVDSSAGLHPLHEAGAFYIQEPSAMMPAAVMDPQPGEWILDLCAAPGGKSTQLGERMQGQGLLVCNEPVPKRAQILARNIERMGIGNALVVSAMPEKLAKQWPAHFDAVQVDAPCSGEGMFRRHPETRDEWTLENRDGCAKRQLDILHSAAELVRPGGRIIYSTCTLNEVENEGVVRAFCQSHPNFAPAPFSLPGMDGAEGMFTCYPHRTQGEGQFVAKLVRTDEGEREWRADASLPKPTKEMIRAVADFSAGAPVPTAMLGETAVYLPDCPDVRGLRVLRCGLHLGQMRGKIFVPDHAWAMSDTPPALPRVALSEAEALRYQAGETMPVSEALKGFVLP